MRTFAWIAFGSMAFTLCLPVGLAGGAAPQSLAHALAIVPLAQISAPPVKPEPPSRESVTRLLQQARTAMEQGYLEAADRSIIKAEEAGVSYPALYFGDTPKKARRDLEKLRARGKRATERTQRGKAAKQTPAAGDTAATAEALAELRAAGVKQAPGAGDIPDAAQLDEPKATPAALPPSAAAGESQNESPADQPIKQASRPVPAPKLIEPPAGVQLITEPPAEEQITSLAAPARPAAPQQAAATAAQNNGAPLLLQARRAIATGDIQSAAALVKQAKGQPQRTSPGGDSIASVEILLKKQQALREVLAAGAQSEAVRRDLADYTLDQAEGLLRWGDLDAAERLANKAVGFGIEYGTFERSPQAVLERIAQARSPETTPANGNGLAGKPGQASAVRQAAGSEPVSPRNNTVIQSDYQEPVNPSPPQRAAQAAQASFDFPVDEPEDTPFDQTLPPARPKPATAQPRIAATTKGSAADSASRAVFYLQRGEAALANGETTVARAYFQKAQQDQSGLSHQDQARLAQHLSLAIKNQAGEGSKLDINSQPSRVNPSAPAAQDDQPAEPQGGGVPNVPAAPEAPADEPEPLPPAESEPQPPAAAAQPPKAAPAAPGQPQRLPDHPEAGSLLQDYSAGQVILHKKLFETVANQQSRARQMMEADPKQALALLQQTRVMIDSAQIEAPIREQLLRRLAKTTEDVQAYYEAHKADIELNEKNQAVVDRIDRERMMKVEIDEKLALLVDEYNKLMDEQRWAEAELVAKKAIELAPKNPLAEQLRWNANFVRRYNQQRQIALDKEDGFVRQLEAVDESSIPFDDRHPINFGNKKHWDDLTDRRRKLAAGDGPHRTDRELQIEQKLKTPVSLQFTDAPLTEVLTRMGDVAGINIHVDNEGLAAEGVSTDTPVTINLKQDISLKSALNLILEPLHLGFVIKDEVLKITSEQYRNGELIPRMYPVADLVIPIPNFAPGAHMGLAGSLHEAYTSLGYGGINSFANRSPLTVVASKDGTPNNAMIDPTLLANVGGSPSTMAGSMLGNNVPTGAGPGGAAAGMGPDFDSLVQLITSTIAPTTWDEVGGSASIEEFRTNLSLVISQTEDVHDQIRDLLAQLRRLQDLQVTIEVRFITLNDNFFERIGVDFDFNINQNPPNPNFGQVAPNSQISFTAPPASGTFNTFPRNFFDPPLSNKQTTVAGQTGPGIFSSNLDIPFTQNSFGLAVPQFGGFDPTAGASIGFAILSNIETFFFINAAEGDIRTNVLQAPKVTLFNGQQATVSDTAQSPFVISVIPVVGDFAAAQQPVIVVLNSGTFMSVQATVSSDRRFVRLTLVPFFSQIESVSTFTFEGSSSSVSNSSNSFGPNNQTTNNTNNANTTTSGTTVQLPTFAFTTVTTTVSVPDGGTILLGGIKRLREGRNEFGVPILSKLPYVNRLFKNVSIGRETQSLMMMVTPRIIIQEEEEQLLGITPAP